MSLSFPHSSRWLRLQWFCMEQSIRWLISSVSPHGFSTEALWSLWLWCVIQNRIIQGPTRYATKFSKFRYLCRANEKKTNKIYVTQVSVVLNGKSTVKFNRKHHTNHHHYFSERARVETLLLPQVKISPKKNVILSTRITLRGSQSHRKADVRVQHTDCIATILSPREWERERVTRDKYESNRALSGIARSRTVKPKQKQRKFLKTSILPTIH